MERCMKKIATTALVGALCFGQVFGMKRGVEKDCRLCFSKYKGIESVESLRRKFMGDYECKLRRNIGPERLIADCWRVYLEGKVDFKKELTVAQKLLGKETIMVGSLKKVDLLIPSTVWNSTYIGSLVYPPLNNQKSSFGQFVFELFNQVVVKIKLLYDSVENVERSDSHKKFIEDKKDELFKLVGESGTSFNNKKFCKEFFDCKSFCTNKTVYGSRDATCLNLYEELLYAGGVSEPEKELRKINEMKEKHEKESDFGLKLTLVERRLKKYLKLKKIILEQKLKRDLKKRAGKNKKESK